MNQMPKHVVTSSGEPLEWNSTAIVGDVPSEMRAIKEAEDGRGRLENVSGGKGKGLAPLHGHLPAFVRKWVLLTERKVDAMIGVYIRPPSMTVENYKTIDDQVRATGVEPKGMKLHSCFGEGDGIAIFDVWESREEFEAFAAVLGPIVVASGLDPLESMFVEMIAFETT
jgi:hypothetical protein